MVASLIVATETKDNQVYIICEEKKESRIKNVKIELEFIKPIKFKPTKQNINIANPNSNFRINRLLFLSVSLLAILMFSCPSDLFK